MKLLILAAALGVAVAGDASAQQAEALLKKYGCLACHGIDRKYVGPAYTAIAAKYKGDAAAATKLAAKVKTGGAGVWGDTMMPPNPAVPDADLKTMIAFILAR